MPPSKKKSAEVEHRRKIVAANLLAGANYRDIAAGAGVSVGTVAGDVKVLMARWRAEQVKTVDDHVTLDMRRMDVALNAIWDEVKAGNYAAIDRMLKVLERRAKMLGYDQPDKVDLTAWRQEAAEMGLDPDDVLNTTVKALSASVSSKSKPSDAGSAAGSPEDEDDFE